MRTVTVGVVGCGGNSDNHLRVYSNTVGARLVAVCDVDSARAEEKARRYGADHVFTEYESMFDLDLDLIDIVTPPAVHSQPSVLALETGHNVLVEKPMAISSKECLDMIDAAKKNGRTLCVNHNHLFFDSIVRTKAAIDSEGLTVSRIRVSKFEQHAYAQDVPRWALTEEHGGLLWEALVHPVYLVQNFLGPINSVYAVARRFREPVFDSLTLVLQGRVGTGLCEYEYEAREPMGEFQLTTEEGHRFSGDFAHDFVLRRSRRYRNRGVATIRSFSDALYEPFTKWTGHLRNLFRARSYEGALPISRTFSVLIRQLLSFLSGGRPSPPVPAEQGLESIRILEAAKRSIKTDRPERV